MTRLAIQAVVGQAHLGPDEEDVLVGAQDTAVVPDVAVSHAHAQIDQHIFANRVLDDLGQDFPAV